MLITKLFRYCLILIIMVPLNALADPLGVIFIVGQTQNDPQNIGSVGRTISIDSDYNDHLCWTGTAAPISVFYNFFTNSIGFAWIHGLPLQNGDSSSKSTIDLFDLRRAAIAYIVSDQSSWNCTVSIDQSAGAGDFSHFAVPNPMNLQLTSPRIKVDSRNWIHLLTVSRYTTPNIKRALYYNRSENEGLDWIGWTFVDSVRTVCPEIAESPNGKLGFAWTHPIVENFVSPVEMVNNDVYYIESPDGGTPDFADAVNVTDFNDALHPNSDSLRAFEDISLVYDNDEVLHIVYTCTGYIQAGGQTITTAGSKIYHYSDNTSFNLVAGRLTLGQVQLENRRMFDRPSIGYDDSADELFIIWNQFDDVSDTSSQGYFNGEIWGAYSIDNGENWSESLNITNTHSPQALPGEALSEDYPSLAAIVNDTLHAAYLLDRNPGPFTGNYPSDIVCQRISVEEFKNPSSLEHPFQKSFEDSFYIVKAHPNPFNNSVNLKFSLSKVQKVHLRIFDLRGRVVAELVNLVLNTGDYLYTWNAENKPSGIYYMELKSEGETQIQKLVLLK